MVSIEAAFARLQQIRTFKTVMIGFVALGFSLFTGGVLSNLYVEGRFGLDTLERGALGTVTGLLVAATIPFAARRFDRLFRSSPAKALRLVGLLIMPVCVFIPIQYVMPSAWSFAVAGIIPGILLLTAFTMVGPITMSIVPYRLRGMGGAISSLYIFFGGATVGALFAALLVDITGPTRRGAHPVGSFHAHRRCAHRAECLVHPQRHGPDRVGTRRRTRRAGAPHREPRRRAGPPGPRRGLLVWSGAGPLRRQLRGAQGRGPRAARHERSGQVDDPARDRRARHTVARSGAPQRRHDHVRRSGTARSTWASNCCPAARACSRT